MKKSLPYFFIAVMIIPSIYAQQNQSRLNQAIAMLENYTAQIPQAIQKTIRCARGVDTCTQTEIIKARAIIGGITAAFAVVSLAVVGLTTAKVKEWGPFKRKPESLIIEGVEYTAEDVPPVESPASGPTTTASVASPARVELVVLTDEENDAKRQAIRDLTDLIMQLNEDVEFRTIRRVPTWVSRSNIQNQIQTLEKLIQDKKISPLEQDSPFAPTIQDIINYAKSIYKS